MTITHPPDGTWRAYHGHSLYAVSGTFCHLMHILKERTL